MLRTQGNKNRSCDCWTYTDCSCRRLSTECWSVFYNLEDRWIRQPGRVDNDSEGHGKRMQELWEVVNGEVDANIVGGVLRLLKNIRNWSRYFIVLLKRINNVIDPNASLRPLNFFSFKKFHKIFFITWSSSKKTLIGEYCQISSSR